MSIFLINPQLFQAIYGIERIGFNEKEMLTIRRVPTVVSNYQEENGENGDDGEQKEIKGCGQNCLGNCCLPSTHFLLHMGFFYNSLLIDYYAWTVGTFSLFCFAHLASWESVLIFTESCMYIFSITWFQRIRWLNTQHACCVHLFKILG